MGVDISPCALQIDQGAYREAMPQVVIVPMSAQPRLCRPRRYADLEPESGLSELVGS